MLGLFLVKKVMQLIESGRFSQRAISRRIGVSRATVAKIARGEHPLCDAVVAVNVVEAAVSVEPGTGPVQRCPNCGVLVKSPCLACHVRAELDQVRGVWPSKCDPREVG